MAWIGKIIGALVGFWATRSIWGAVVGAFIGHLIDQGMSPTVRVVGGTSTIPEVFFRTTFELMGHVAKSDGRVSEAEIAAARRLMQELNLGAADVSLAINFFRAGKAPTFNFDVAVERLREACGQRHDLLRAFIELQLRAALAGNGMSPPARSILTRLAERLGMSGMEFARMEAILRTRQEFRAGSPGPAGAGKSMAEYYAELEVDAAASDSDEDFCE